jgi:hypothetical protein
MATLAPRSITRAARSGTSLLPEPVPELFSRPGCHRAQARRRGKLARTATTRVPRCHRQSPFHCGLAERVREFASRHMLTVVEHELRAVDEGEHALPPSLFAAPASPYWWPRSAGTATVHRFQAPDRPRPRSRNPLGPPPLQIGHLTLSGRPGPVTGSSHGVRRDPRTTRAQASRRRCRCSAESSWCL